MSEVSGAAAEVEAVPGLVASPAGEVPPDDAAVPADACAEVDPAGAAPAPPRTSGGAGEAPTATALAATSADAQAPAPHAPRCRRPSR